MSAPVVIGVGNSLRGDDRAGLEVARRLRGHPDMDVREHEGEAIGLLDEFADARAVIVIDTIHSGASPGTLHRIDASVKPVPAVLRRTSSHAVGVGEAIELARVLGKLPSTVVVHGVEGESFEGGAALSPAVACAIEPLADAVRREALALSE